MKDKPQIRFKQFSDEWEEKELGEYFTERNERSSEGELISVTINQGVVRAKDLSRIDSSSSDKSNYKIVRKGDIAYNTMRMWQGAEGCSSYDGILSPAYTIAIPNENAHSQFFAYMFKSDKLIRSFKINSQGLTSDTWNLKFYNFSMIKQWVPTLPEQKKIGEFFAQISRLIDLAEQKLEKTVLVKKSLLEKMFPKDARCVPEVRFKGFTGDWEEKEYTEIFDTSVSNNTLSRAELTNEKTSIRNIHYGDVLINYDSILDVKKDKFPFIPDDVKISYRNLLKNGDIIFADTAEDETCGKATEINNLGDEKIVAGLHTFVARPKIRFEEKYLGYFTNSPSFHNQLLPHMQGTKVTSISKSSIQKTLIKYPSLPEQQKIGQFFSQIDKTISAYRAQLEKLKTVKKSLLQKMFV